MLAIAMLDADDEEGPRPLRSMRDGQRRGDRRTGAGGRRARRRDWASSEPRWRAICGCPVAIDGCDPHDRRMAHRRAWPDHAGHRGGHSRCTHRTEALGGQAALTHRRSSTPVPAQRLGFLDVEPTTASTGKSSSAASRNEAKCDEPSTPTTVPLGACTNSTGSSRFACDAYRTETLPSAARRSQRATRVPPSPAGSASHPPLLCDALEPTRPCSQNQSND